MYIICVYIYVYVHIYIYLNTSSNKNGASSKNPEWIRESWQLTDG
jgi:hypothetical protein